jgi:hypothetical protein
MMSNERHIVVQTDFTTGLTRLDQQYNWIRRRTTDKEEKKKGPRFAFLKISASAHCTHLQSRAGQHSDQALRKSSILPTLKKQYL